jgi:mediator of RNA polymerase II transcription subunit 13
MHRPSPLAESIDIHCEPSEDEMSHSEDEVVSEEEDDDEEVNTPATSRPLTPPPPYLPLGPTLLHTQFTHTHLLPLSKPLRPPGSSIIPGGLANGPAATPLPIANVPTPVSPAAGLGLSAEKWRALEVVINVLAKEAVENVVWRDTWMASNAFGFGSSGSSEGGFGKKYTEVWVSDVKLVEKVLGNLESVKAGLSIGDVFGLGSLPVSYFALTDMYLRCRHATSSLSSQNFSGQRRGHCDSSASRAPVLGKTRTWA